MPLIFKFIVITGAIAYELYSAKYELLSGREPYQITVNIRKTDVH